MSWFILAAYGQNQGTVSEESLQEKHANITGEVTEMSSRGKSSHTHVVSQG